MTLEQLFEEIRALRRDLAGEQQRRRMQLMSGTICAVEGARCKVRLQDEDEDGAPLESPWVRIANYTGKNGGGVSRFTRMGLGDPVLVVSTNGKLGPGSFVYPGPDSDETPAPGSAEQDGEVWQVGETTLRLKPDRIEFSVGAMNGVIKPDTFRARYGEGAGAPRVTLRPLAGPPYVKLRVQDRWLIVTQNDIRSSEPVVVLPDPEPSE